MSKPVETLGYPSLAACVEAMIAEGKNNKQIAEATGRKIKDINRVRQNLQYKSVRNYDRTDKTLERKQVK
jgi:uncharacterized protein YerC